MAGEDFPVRLSVAGLASGGKSVARKRKLHLELLENREVPATFSVSLIDPPMGVQGDSDCRVIAGRLRVRPAFDPDGDGCAEVVADSADEAIRKAVIGRVMINTGKFGVPNSIFHFGESTSRTSKAEAKAEKKAFYVSDGVICLEDLAKFPRRSDWDFNDSFWRVSATELKLVEGWNGFREGPQATPRPGQPAIPEAHWTRSGDVVRTPQGDLNDPVLKGSLVQEGPRFETVETFEAFRMQVEYRPLDMTAIAPAPGGKRLEESNQHFSNTGIYIYDRYEVQIVDPSQFRLSSGETGLATGAEMTDEIVNDANSNHVSFYVPGGLYGVPIASPDQKYWNRALPTGEWNRLELEFKPAELKEIDPKDPSKGKDAKVAVTPARISVRLNGEVVLDGAWISDLAGALKGTGSRARAEEYLVSGPVKLQSHWGSQVEFRAVRIESLPDC